MHVGVHHSHVHVLVYYVLHTCTTYIHVHVHVCTFSYDPAPPRVLGEWPVAAMIRQLLE